MEGVDKNTKNINVEEKNNAKDEIHKIEEYVKGSKVNNKATNVIIMQRNDLQCDKKTFCSDDVKKHVSLLCKYVVTFREFILPISSLLLHLTHNLFSLINPACEERNKLRKRRKNRR